MPSPRRKSDAHEHYAIPDEAIRNSEIVHHQNPASAVPIGKGDPYVEDRVAKDQPTAEEVRQMVPDTTVRGG